MRIIRTKDFQFDGKTVESFIDNDSKKKINQFLLFEIEVINSLPVSYSIRYSIKQERFVIDIDEKVLVF